MQFLLLKVASSVAMGVLLKLADVRKLDRIPLIRANYAAAAIIAFFIAVGTGAPRITTPTAILAAIIGGLFVAGLFLWAKTIAVAGLALSVVAMRLSLVVPVAVSAVVWHERPGPVQLAGVVVALAAMALVISSQLRPAGEPGAAPKGRAWLWMLGLFLVDGLVNTGAKVFEEMMPAGENLPFQVVIFVTAFFVTSIVYFLRRERVSQPSLVFGVGLGAANLGNYLFLVMALAVLPGVVVYPVFAAGEVALMALAGIIIWREKVSMRSWLGIGLGVLALILIQLGRA